MWGAGSVHVWGAGFVGMTDLRLTSERKHEIEGSYWTLMTESVCGGLVQDGCEWYPED